MAAIYIKLVDDGMGPCNVSKSQTAHNVERVGLEHVRFNELEDIAWYAMCRTATYSIMSTVCPTKSAQGQVATCIAVTVWVISGLLVYNFAI